MLRAVNWGGGGGGGGGGAAIFPLLRLPVGVLLALALTAFLFRQAVSSRLAALGGYHDGLRGAQMLSSSVENLSARRYNSSIVASGSRDKDLKNGVVGPKLILRF